MSDAQQGRLIWRCRRGMKELDLLLRRYLTERWPAASEREKACFEQFLDLPDPTIAAYLMGREDSADPDVRALLVLLQGLAARSGVPAQVGGASQNPSGG
jgi:antitoxin CptB